MGGPMSFAIPQLLALIPLSLIALALTLRTKRNRSGKPVLLALLRAGTLSALSCALAQPFLSRQQPSRSLPVLVDISSSVAVAQGDALLQGAESISSALAVPLTVFPFSRFVSASGTSAGAPFATVRRGSEKLDTGASDLGAALREASSLSSPVVLLLSDGYETTGSAVSALSSAGQPKIFPLTAAGESPQNALSISQLYVPLTVKAKKAAEVRATVTSGSTEPHDAELVVKHGEGVVLSKQLRVPPGGDVLVTAQTNPALEGLNMVTATLSWRDADGPHSVTKTSWLSSERRSRVLLLSGTLDDERYLTQILKSQAYELEARVAEAAVASSEPPSQFRAVILNNVPASALPRSFVDALPKFVRDGGGLIMVGGNRSFGLGGYIGSPIEDILPVTLVPPHTEKKRLNVAVQLVIDKSRSMAEDSRLEFAKAAAREVVDSLKDDDFVGVIGFEEVAFIALPMSRVGDVRGTASDRISRLFPTNRTNLYPALEEGRRGLSRVSAGRKHLIVLTDGQIPDQGPFYFNLIHQMRLLGITVSTVLVGTDAPDAFLVEIANQGGGSFYQTTDPRNLPRIFLSDIKVASGERTLKEEPQIPVLLGPDGVRSTRIDSFPPLRGFVETLSRRGAATELLVSEEDKRYPLLASWKVGGGRAIAFTSDANGRWSAPWLRWHGIEEFWSDLVESAQPSPLEKPLSTQFDLRTWVEGSDLIIDLSLFEEPRVSSVAATVVLPSGESRDLPFSPKQRGHYQARLAGAAAGTYRATVSLGSQKLPEVAWTLSGELFGEQQHRTPNLELLQAIANRTGGKINPTPDDIRPLMTQVLERREVAHLFLMAALLLFLLELLLREASRRALRPAGA